MAKIIRQKRKGISSVVGAVFMILVMVGALNVMIWTMQQQDRVTETIIEKSNSNLNKLNEDIDISNVRIDGDKLNMTVTNAGGAAATIKSIYVVNETANEQYRYDLDLVVDGRESLNIDGQDVPLIVKDDTRYSVRLVTESGNTVTTSITPLSSVALPMQLYIIPPTITPGENVTVLFAVTNNLTDSALGVGVTPTLNYDLGCSPGPNCVFTEHVAPSGSASLTEGNTMLFKWVYEVDAPDETDVIFNASLANAKQGNYIQEKARVKLVDSAQTSFSSEIIVSSSLVQKPEIFLILPNPFGDSSDKGLVGVVVANPTENTMTVSRIVINTYSSKPTGGGGNEIIPSSCSAITEVYPDSGWSCPHANMIEWKNTAAPESIGGLEAQSFLLRIKPDDISDAEPAFTVAVAVFTNLGQFTKIGYSAGMDSNNLSLANVYMTDSTDQGEAVQNSHILGNVSNLEPGVVRRFNVTVADLDASTSTHIDSGTKLIVNVPRGFTGVTVQSYTGFVDPPEVIPYGDGTTQIVATLSVDVGDQGSAEAKVLSFDAAPPVPEPAAQRIYILYALLDGTADSTGINGATDFSVGAVAEMALVVNES